MPVPGAVHRGVNVSLYAKTDGNIVKDDRTVRKCLLLFESS